MAERIIVLGGTRSGKSAVAESLVAGGSGVTYVATGLADDDEMAARIATHRARRPAAWRTCETDDLTEAVRTAPHGDAVLIDALGTWLTRRMSALALWPEEDAGSGGAAAAGVTDGFAAGRTALLAEADACWQAAAARHGGPVVLVAEDAGAGLVPPHAATRRWVDLHGEVLQRLAAYADRVLHVVAGRVHELPAPPAAGEVGAPAERGVPGQSGATAAGPAPPDLRMHGDRQVAKGALDFAVNVSGDGPPAHVRAAVQASLDGLAAYPDDADARAAVAARHDRTPAEVAVTAGAAEAFWLLPTVLDARHAAVVHPSFTEPEAALRAAGVAVTHVWRDAAAGWALDPEAVPADCDVVVVGNPNNPTGTLDPADRVARLCRPGRCTIVDEAFMDFVPDAGASLAARTDLPGLVVVRSVTKLWGLAGLRAGYLLADPALVTRLGTLRQPWPVSGPALAALIACVGDEGWRVAAAERVGELRARLQAALAALDGVEVHAAAANFLLLRVADGPGLCAALAARGIAVRTSTFPGLDRSYLRVAVREPADQDRLVAACGQILRSRAAAPPARGARAPR